MEDEVRKIDNHFGCQSASVNMGSWLRLNGRQSKTKQRNKYVVMPRAHGGDAVPPPCVRASLIAGVSLVILVILLTL